MAWVEEVGLVCLTICSTLFYLSVYLAVWLSVLSCLFAPIDEWMDGLDFVGEVLNPWVWRVLGCRSVDRMVRGSVWNVWVGDDFWVS